ncbi:heterocyst differentiation related protein [Fischerella muscicola CCMEE 5323]|uniref:Heterocyst differentiation related protein n=1 Tax=Fischerella muscicola CCMEE 5323 TaxID=2019572 RepID=A0A2N6JX93_FISMU|nr:heterocyst differentiation related protein [Fischerella muscicola]PLZ84980.1 heterocyst differentiation related protein [Fischerella muscicola CCMEE 5323]
MSESMAFIGGVAVAGLAAILLLKGTGTSLQQPNIAIPQISNLVPQPQPQYYPPTSYPPVPQPPPVSPNTDERVAIERVKMENDILKRENEQLKVQIQQIQAQAQNAQQAAFSYQQQLQSQNAAQLQQQQQSQNRWWSSPIVWAVGGMSLTIGGGIVVAGVLSLFSPKQRPRTVQVIHPYNGPTPPLAPVRRAEFLPPRTEARRVDMPEYDDTY